VTEELAALGSPSTGELRSDAARDAADLVAALVDADHRMTDDELRAYVEVIGPLLDPPLTITPEQLRHTSLVKGRSDWLERPSPLFELLVDADARYATTSSHAYYQHAMRIAHDVIAVDLVPSPDELDAVERLRSTLLTRMDRAGVARPGHQAAQDSRPAVADGATRRGSRSSTPSRVAADRLSPEPATTSPSRSIEDLLAELDDLVGLEPVKQDVHRLTSLLQVQRLRAARGLPNIEASHHLVFTGNPGTGKTTVGRLLAQIYRTLGILETGQLIETDRSDLVAGFVGQTAIKTHEVLERAVGGMLLIDEAYALARGGETDFGKEAIDTLVKFMEDHRDDLAVIAAGYPDEMSSFIAANPGLSSRFTRTLHFPDYTSDELALIFDKMATKQEYHPTEDALARVRAIVDEQPRDRGFGNARFVRNLFESAVTTQALRLAPLSEPSIEELTTLIASDIGHLDDR
jgi:Holliday junction resolvasome RuvABC ATP-dependent DNA helicase subunit